MAGTVNNLLRTNLTYWGLSPRPPTRASPLNPTGGLPSPDSPDLVSPSLVCITLRRTDRQTNGQTTYAGITHPCYTW